MKKPIVLLVDDFMFNCQSRNLSKKSMASYEQTLKLFAKYLEQEKKITDISEVTEKIIREYIINLQERGKYTVVADKSTIKYNLPHNRKDCGKKISVTTINNYIRNIKVFFNYLVEERVIKKSPMEKIKQLKNDRKPEDFISDEDFLRLLKNIDTTKLHEYRDYTIIMLLIDTGMRIGECLSIPDNDVDLENRSILLPAENTKGKKNRYVYFSIEMQKELKRWLQYKDRYLDTEYLFPTNRGTELLVRSFEKKIKEYCQRINLDIHPHQLRNNFAKRFLIAGGSIYTLSQILGHSSVKVTEKAYLDLNDEDIRKTYQNFSPLTNIKKHKK